MPSPDGLRVTDVSVTLGGVRILEDVSFDVASKESFGIIGPNGAGKTTVINVISGAVPILNGEVSLNGTRLNGLRPHRVKGSGVGRSFQTTQYFHDLTFRELVSLSAAPNKVRGALGFRDHRGSVGAAHAALAMLDLDRYAEVCLGEVSTAVQKLVDMARAVAAGTALLLLDEPTSGVSQADRALITRALTELRQSGRTIVMIDHDPAFVVANCDRIMAMNFGRVLTIGTPSEVMEDAEVRRSYLGEMTTS